MYNTVDMLYGGSLTAQMRSGPGAQQVVGRGAALVSGSSRICWQWWLLSVQLRRLVSPTAAAGCGRGQHLACCLVARTYWGWACVVGHGSGTQLYHTYQSLCTLYTCYEWTQHAAGPCGTAAAAVVFCCHLCICPLGRELVAGALDRSW